VSVGSSKVPNRNEAWPGKENRTKLISPRRAARKTRISNGRNTPRSRPTPAAHWSRQD